MTDWQKGPFTEKLCQVYEGRMLQGLFPKGLRILKIEKVKSFHINRYFLISEHEGQVYDGNFCLAYKVIMP